MSSVAQIKCWHSLAKLPIVQCWSWGERMGLCYATCFSTLGTVARIRFLLDAPVPFSFKHQTNWGPNMNPLKLQQNVLLSSSYGCHSTVLVLAPCSSISFASVSTCFALGSSCQLAILPATRNCNPLVCANCDGPAMVRWGDITMMDCDLSNCRNLQP